MSLLLDEQEDMYAMGGYSAQIAAAADFGLALTSHAPPVDYLSDAHMQQAQEEEAAADPFTDESHSLFSKQTFAIKNHAAEEEEESALRSAAANMLDPFGFEPASPVLPHHADAGADAMDEPQLFKHEHSVLSEFDAVPNNNAAAAAGSFLLSSVGISNAHMPMRQNATPQPPVPSMMAVPRRGAEIKVKREMQIKQEPVSPTASYITSPQSRLSSPMPALVSSPSIGDAALSPTLIGGVRSGSSAGESGSAGSGGSGSNSAAHSCASASDSESDVGGAFDEPMPASAGKPKAKAASSKSNSNKGKAGRKRKSKAGSGNSSGAEQAGAGLDGSVGDEMDDAAGAAAADGAPGDTNKRQQRLQRNRASAQLSRERKKQYMRLLEKQLKELADLNEGLSVQIRALTSENTQLKTRLSSLSMRERVQARYPKVAASSSSQASTASMQSSPMHAPAASPSGSSEADSLSNPASPRSVEGDVPRNAKRVKVEAYSPPHAAASANSTGGGRPAGAFSARAGLLLFTLVCSVGLLYNFASVDVAPMAKPFDLNGSGASVAAANVVLARALGSPSPSPSRATVTLMSEGGGGDGLEDAVVHRSHSAITATQPARGRVLASVSDTESDNSDAFALVPLASNSAASSVAAPMEIVDEGDSKALDVYTRSSASSSVSVVGGDEDGKLSASSATHLGSAASSADVQLLRRLLLSAGTNSSSAASEGTNFMFCPQSLSISRDTWTGLLHKHNIVQAGPGGNYTGTPSEMGEEKQVALFETKEAGAGAGSSAASVKRSRSGKKKGTVARLRKAIGLPQLPAPGSDAQPHKIDAIDSDRAAASSLLLSDLSSLPAVQSGLQVGDKLLLWVPLQLNSANSGRQNGTVLDEAAQQPKQGLVEIACHIAHVRPIVLS